MVEITVGNLIEATGAKLVAGNVQAVCHGVCIDSREVQAGSIFVAFPGERVDGNAFAPQAVSAGAACVVLTVEPNTELLALAKENNCALVACADPTEFLLNLAHAYRMQLDCMVVGITGSIGKTTTKDVLTALLSKRYRVHATRGNFNNLIGLPLTVLSAPANTEVLVLEMGMDGLGQIERLSACARPNMAVITKVGTSHVGMLGSRENIARAKAEIISGMATDAALKIDGKQLAPTLVLHGEDDFTSFIANNFAHAAGVDVVLAGTAASNAVRVEHVELSGDGCPSFDLTFEDGEQVHANLAITGAQSVPNALFAAALAHRLGVSAAQIVEAFGELQLTGRRAQVCHLKNAARVIDDSYNASPESMAAGLDLLASLPCEGARIAILGEMGELGSEAPRLHALVGAYAAAKKPSMLVCVGKQNAQHMADAARLMGMDEGDVQVLDSCDALIAQFAHLLGEHDLALVKGSRFVGLDRYVEEVCGNAR